MKNYNPPRYFTTHAFLHKVFDRRSKQQVCSCHNVADAEMIAEALNNAAAAPKEPSSSDLRTIHNALIFYKTHPQFSNSFAEDQQRRDSIQDLADRIRDNLL